MCKPTRFEQQRQFIAIAIFFQLAFISTFLPECFAHAIFLGAHVEGDMVVVAGGFSDGTFCSNAKVTVFDQEGNLLLEGKTNEEGTFSFMPPLKADLKVVLDAGMGHRDECSISAEELPDIPAPATTTETVSLPSSSALAQMPSKEIEAIVDRVIQKRLRPLTQTVAKLERNRGISLDKIFSGIGYLFGLIGIASYFKFRKGRKD